MRKIAFSGLLTTFLLLTACGGGSSGTLMGRVVDGFGYPLGGDAVMIKLSDNPAIHRPDRWGNFIVHAPTGEYTMRISFSNPPAGFHYKLEEDVRVVKGSKQLGTFTLLNVQNMEAWAAYREHDWNRAIKLFGEQADLARSAQLAWLPYMRYVEGEPDENTLLTQGVLSAENGLGWCYARGVGDVDAGSVHYTASLSGGYNNYDAMVGLAGIALGKGDGETAVELLQKVIDEPGYYDSSQIHDYITEVDLVAARCLAEFLLGYDGISRDTAKSIEDRLINEANMGSLDLLEALDTFR